MYQHNLIFSSVPECYQFQEFMQKNYLAYNSALWGKQFSFDSDFGTFSEIIDAFFEPSLKLVYPQQIISFKK